MVGKQTVLRDDPLLTARTPKPPARTATRLVLDSECSLPMESQLVRTAGQTPTLIATGPRVAVEKVRQLEVAGCEVVQLMDQDPVARVEKLLDQLGTRRMTNLLVEGGGALLGCLHDLDLIDEAHVFVASKLAGGAQATAPMAGLGVERISLATQIKRPTIERWDDDIYIHGRVERDRPG